MAVHLAKRFKCLGLREALNLPNFLSVLDLRLLLNGTRYIDLLHALGTATGHWPYKGKLAQAK